MINYLIIKAVGDFMPNDPANGRIVKIGGAILAEESALKDACWEFWKTIEEYLIVYFLFLHI